MLMTLRGRGRRRGRRRRRCADGDVGEAVGDGVDGDGDVDVDADGDPSNSKLLPIVQSFGNTTPSSAKPSGRRANARPDAGRDPTGPNPSEHTFSLEDANVAKAKYVFRMETGLFGDDPD